jgi:TonB family protein
MGLLAVVTPLWAAFESIKIEVTDEPEMPASLHMNGLTQGRVVVAIAVGPDGQLADWLVLVATHRELIKPSIESLQRWRYSPARFDGQPVFAQLQLALEFSQTGAVVSRSAIDTPTDIVERLGGRRNDYQACPADEIDRPLVAVTTVAPRYATEAEKEGMRGRVVVYFFIDEQGAVRMPSVAAEANPYLSSLAIEALKAWKFEPPTRRGRPVLIAASQEFSFGDSR